MKSEFIFIAENNCDLVPALRSYVKTQGLRESILLNSDVYYNGMPLDCRFWEQTRLNAGDKIQIFPNVYVVSTAFVASIIGVAATSFTAIAVTAVANFVVGMAVSFVLNWSLSKLFPTQKPEAARQAPDTEALPSISGANNQYKPYEAAPLVIGETRTSPDFAVPYYSVVDNGSQKIRHLFCVSASSVDVWDLRKDDTSIEGLSITYKVYSGWTGEDLLYFDYSTSVTQQDFSLRDKAIFIAESPVNVRQVAFVVGFPQGLRSENAKTGDQYATGVTLTIKMTDEEGNETTYTREIVGKAYKSSWMGYVNITLPTISKWKIEVYGWYPYKNTAMNNYRDGDYMYRYIEGTISELQWVRNEPAIKYNGKSMTLIELEAVATDKLTGGLNTINCMARLKGMQADGTLVESSNPALQTRRILKDLHIINNSQYVVIDDDSFAAYEAHCDKYGITVNGIENEGRRTGEVLSDMLEIGQGYIDNANGIYSIVFDNPSNPIVDKINSRNSWGMTIAHSFNILPIDGLRINFNNKEMDYQVDERLVHEDGIIPVNVQQLSNKFIDNSDLAYKYGMLNLAMDRLRKAIYTFSTDWRSIDYKLGQKIQISHPIFFLGVGTAGKVIDHIQNEQGMYEAVVLDQLYPTTLGVQYILQSSNKYSMQFWDIKAIDNESTHTLYFQVPIANVNMLPEIGSIMTFGETEKAGVDVLIRNITRNADFTAEVECAPATDIYSALTGDIPDFTSSLTYPTLWQGAKPNAPKIVRVNVNLDTATASGVGISSEATMEISYTEKSNVEFSHYIIGVRITTDKGAEPDLPIIDDEGQAIVNDISTQYDFYTGYDKQQFLLVGVFNNVDYEITIKAVSTRGIESDTTTYIYSPEDSFFEIPDVEGFFATVESDGIRFHWQKVNGYEPVIYSVTGDIAFESVENTYLSKDLSSKNGMLTFSIKARDVLGRESTGYAHATVNVDVPSAPSIDHTLKTDGLFLTWTDCETTWAIRHYKVVDSYTGKVHLLNDEQLDVSERPQGAYSFSVQAVDIYGNVSTVSTYSIEIEDIQAPEPIISIVGGVLRMSWNAVVSPFPVKQYEIYTTSGQLLHSTASTFYDVPPDAENTAGVVEYLVRAVDTVGNASEFALFSTRVDAPATPEVVVGISDDKRQVAISWTMPRNQVPVEGYDLVAQYDLNGITQEVDYGFYDTTVAYVEALSADVDMGEYTFMVRARNYMDMTGEWGYNTIVVRKPSIVLFTKSFSIDNNMQLYWIPPTQFTFAIKEYIVWKQDGILGARIDFKEEGRIDSMFFSSFESQAGDYTFRVAAVDWAGNVGDTNDVVITMDEPPDFNLYDDYDTDFEGDKDNFVVTDGHMIGGVVAGETWQENVNRIGLGNALTWQGKHNTGAEYFPSPHTATCTYTETVDHGVIIASTRITVTPTYQVLEGTPELRCKIEISRDGVAWTTAIENGLDVYALQFRYVRYTLSILDGLVSFSRLNFKLSVKLKRDSGVAYYDASLGFEGVYVPFSAIFIALHGQPIVSVDETTFDNPLTAYVNFDGSVSHPIGFFVYVLDKNGNPHNGTVSWIANGV